MSHHIHKTLTAKRRAWLVELRDHGPAKRRRSVVGYQCMHLGWTEWDFRRDGKPISKEEAQEQMRKGVIDFTNDKERITSEGLKALEGEQ